MSSLRVHLRSNLIGYAALFVALGGTAYAIGANTIGSRQIKNNKVKSVDLKDGDLRAADVDKGAIQLRLADDCGAGEAIRSVDEDGLVSCETVGGGGPPTGPAGGDLTGSYPNPLVGANAIGGPEIDEATLGTVPTAATAQNLANTEIRHFSFGGDLAATNTTILDDFHNLTLQADCDNSSGNPNVELFASTDATFAWLGYTKFDTLNNNLGGDHLRGFTAADGNVEIQASGPSVTGFLTFSATLPTTDLTETNDVTVIYAASEFDEPMCRIAGIALGG